MKAIILPEYGAPDVLRFEEVETPVPKQGEVLIKVHNVSVGTTLDIILRQGNYPMKPPLPHVMGTDPVGEIAGLGEDVTNHKIGDRVGAIDLNAWMVINGWAVAYRRYSRDYVLDEQKAKESKKGIWQGHFIMPWSWRGR